MSDLRNLDIPVRVTIHEGTGKELAIKLLREAIESLESGSVTFTERPHHDSEEDTPF